MTVEGQVDAYVAGLPTTKAEALRTLHDLIRGSHPDLRLWYLDGRDGDRIVANPNIGYGVQTIAYASGKSREFYRLGLSANTTGISVYVMGLADKTYLRRTYGDRLGKASVTGYCIKFRSLPDVDLAVLQDIFRFALERPAPEQPVA